MTDQPQRRTVDRERGDLVATRVHGEEQLAVLGQHHGSLRAEPATRTAPAGREAAGELELTVTPAAEGQDFVASPIVADRENGPAIGPRNSCHRERQRANQRPPLRRGHLPLL